MKQSIPHLALLDDDASFSGRNELVGIVVLEVVLKHFLLCLSYYVVVELALCQITEVPDHSVN